MSSTQLIDKSSIPSQPIVDLITNTFLGSRGAKYKLLNTKTRIQQLDNPLFLSLQRNQTAYGNITFCNRIQKNISENYIRYFAFQTRFQSRKENSSNSRKGFLKEQFHSYLNQDVFEKNASYCYYAFVDQQNYKSLGMGDIFGFKEYGDFSTTTFSRRKPKNRLKIQEIEGDLKDQYLEELKSTYKNYNFFHPVNIEKGKVFGYVENGEILLACTVHKTSWEVKSLPGINGERKINFLRKAPILNTFFRNGEIQFEGLEGLIVKRKELINAFLESVLFESQAHTIIWWSDVKCEIYNLVNPLLKKGILARFSKQENAKIIIKHNLKNSNHLSTNPTYMSAYDVS